MLRTLALTVAYDGTDWVGFQRQPVLPSIQRVLETALTGVLRHEVRIAAAGRTDAGVHALGQIISLQTPNPLPLERLPRAINLSLPKSIRVLRAEERPADFNARLSALYRRYWYLLQVTRRTDPVRGRYCWQLPQALDATAMQDALHPLVGRHDFAAFCNGGDQRKQAKGTIRTLQHARVRSWAGCLVVDIQADSFVHRMVRLLVSNLVIVGSGERPVSWLETLLHSGDRPLAGASAPPNGLILMKIGYPPITYTSHSGEEVGVLNDENIPGKSAGSRTPVAAD